MSSRKTSKFRQKKIVLLASPLLFFSLVCWFFFQAGALLVVADATDALNGDSVILLLMGGLVPRANQAISLVKSGVAHKIIFFEPEDRLTDKVGLTQNEGVLTKKYLLQQGIQEANIELIRGRGVSSTFAESREVTRWLLNQAKMPDNLIVVTSWFHTRRASKIVRQSIKQSIKSGSFRVVSSPAFSKKSNPERWWTREQSFLQVYQEYLKTVYYWFKY